MKEISMRPLSSAGMQPIKPGGAEKASGSGFSEVFSRFLAEANKNSLEADQLVKGLAAGEHANIHETMIAMEKSGISFKMVARVQQKVIDAYREVMRMQI